MRIVVALLLLANLTLFVYTLLPSGGGEGVRLSQQVSPEKIKLLTPQEVAALGPAKLGRLLTLRRVEVDNAFSVSISPFPSRPAAETRAAELRKQGVKELAVVDVGRGQFAVAFGTFRTEPAAQALAESLGKQGVKLVRVQARQQPLTQTLLVVRDPQQPVVARLKELQGQYAGTDIKVGACAAAS